MLTDTPDVGSRRRDFIDGEEFFRIISFFYFYGVVMLRNKQTLENNRCNHITDVVIHLPYYS